MKILFLTNDINLQKGGQELANIFLLDNFKKSGFKVKIFNQIFFDETFNYKKINCDYVVDFRRGFFKKLFEFVKLLKRVDQEEKFDVILVSSTPFSTLLFVFFIYTFRLFKNVPKIHFCHIDPYSSLKYASRIGPVLFILGLVLYRRFERIVVTNEDMKNVFIKKYFVKKDKIEVIPYPYRDKLFDLMKEPLPEKIKKIPRPWITTITRLEYNQKDPKTLLRAFSLVLKEFPTASLLICGVGPKEEDLKDYAKQLGIDKNVYFLGFQKNPINILKNSDMFVLSSKAEGYGIVLIEALLSSIPVISTNCPVGPRIALKNGKYGKLVKVGDYRKMGQEIIDNLKNKEIYFKRSKLIAKEVELIYNPKRVFSEWYKLITSYGNK